MGLESTIIAASLIMASGMAGIGGSIWWAQRDRTMDYGGKIFLGRNEDRLERKLDRQERKIDRVLETLSKKQSD